MKKVIRIVSLKPVANMPDDDKIKTVLVPPEAHSGENAANPSHEPLTIDLLRRVETALREQVERSRYFYPVCKTCLWRNCPAKCANCAQSGVGIGYEHDTHLPGWQWIKLTFTDDQSAPIRERCLTGGVDKDVQLALCQCGVPFHVAVDEQSDSRPLEVTVYYQPNGEDLVKEARYLSAVLQRKALQGFQTEVLFASSAETVAKKSVGMLFPVASELADELKPTVISDFSGEFLFLR